MTQNEMVQKIAAVVSTLGEVKSQGVPESSLYLAVCDSNLDEWNTLKAVMVKSDLIEVKFHAVSLTQKGKQLADKINAALVRLNKQAA